MQIVIKWAEGEIESESTEFLDFDLDKLDENGVRALKQTREWWSNKKIWVCWGVKCRLEKIDGGHQILVKYKKDRQKDENVTELLEGDDWRNYCGENRIIVMRDPQTMGANSSGRLEWNSKESPEEIYYGKWRIIDGERPPRNQKQREREWKLRGEILDEDGKCVISKERTPQVLDAAHIVPVAECGGDSIENAIILRTDIHRLYDRGMFLINPNDGKISKSSMSRNLSRKYKKLLRNAKLPERTLNRVQEALQERWSNRRPDTGRE